MKKNIQIESGFSLLEIILAIAIFVMIMPSIIYILIDSEDSFRQGKERLEATAFAEEGIEAARNIRDSGWDNLIVGDHGLAVSGGRWIFSGTSDTDATGKYTRHISVTSADGDHKQVVSSVTWSFTLRRTGNIDLTTYLNNWSKNTPTAPNWSSPQIISYADIAASRNATDIFVNGNYAYLTTGNTGDSQPEFFIIDISNLQNLQTVGSYNIGANANAVYISGNYAYVATDSNAKEIMVLNISNPASITEAEFVNTSGSSDANDLFILDNYLYVITQNNSSGREFYIYNCIDPTNIPDTAQGSAELGTNGRTIYISGNFAFVGTSSNSQEVKVVNIINKSSPQVVGIYNNDGNADAQSIYVNGNTIYLGVQNNGLNSEFFILSANTSNPNNVTIAETGELELGAAVNGVYADIANSQVFLATGITNKEFYIVNIINPFSPAEKASLDLANSATAVFYNGAKAFISTIDNQKEIYVIGPGD